MAQRKRKKPPTIAQRFDVIKNDLEELKRGLLYDRAVPFEGPQCAAPEPAPFRAARIILALIAVVALALLFASGDDNVNEG